MSLRFTGGVVAKRRDVCWYRQGHVLSFTVFVIFLKWRRLVWTCVLTDTVSPHERLKIAYGQTHAVKGLNETVEVVWSVTRSLTAICSSKKRSKEEKLKSLELRVTRITKHVTCYLLWKQGRRQRGALGAQAPPFLVDVFSVKSSFE